MYVEKEKSTKKGNIWEQYVTVQLTNYWILWFVWELLWSGLVARIL